FSLSLAVVSASPDLSPFSLPDALPISVHRLGRNAVRDRRLGPVRAAPFGVPAEPGLCRDLAGGTGAGAPARGLVRGRPGPQRHGVQRAAGLRPAMRGHALPGVATALDRKSVV